MSDFELKDLIFMPTLEDMVDHLNISEEDEGKTRLWYGYSFKAFRNLDKKGRKTAKNNWCQLKAHLRGEKNANHNHIALAGRIWKTAIGVIVLLGAALLAYGLIHGHLSHTGWHGAIKNLLADSKNISILCLAGAGLGGLFYATLAQRDIHNMLFYFENEKDNPKKIKMK